MSETTNIAKWRISYQSNSSMISIGSELGRQTSIGRAWTRSIKRLHTLLMLCFTTTTLTRFSRTYVACDLKSYAVSSISRNAVSIAAVKLARAVSCAEKSAEWQQRYLHQNVTPQLCALLFVYNHDGDYDSDFQNLHDRY